MEPVNKGTQGSKAGCGLILASRPFGGKWEAQILMVRYFGESPVGYAILRAENYETIDEVVFAEPGDMNHLGVRTIEGFGVMVDNIGHRFVATTTLVATLP